MLYHIILLQISSPKFGSQSYPKRKRWRTHGDSLLFERWALTRQSNFGAEHGRGVSMTETASSALSKGSDTSYDASRSSVLHVRTSCRLSGTPREPRENRAGFKLYQKLRAMIHKSPLGGRVEVRPTECLSLCPRPCGIALSSSDGWSYLFGDQHSDESVRDIVECVSLYIGTADGLMPREQRPKSLRASILGRVPPQGKRTIEAELTSETKQHLPCE